MQFARLSTSDAMAAFFVLAALFFLAEKRSVALCYCFLLLAILTRIDNILPCFFILTALAVANRWARLSLPNYLLLLVGSLFCFAIAPYLFSTIL